MRTLILILVLAISAQPLQAGYCDMESAGDGTAAAHHMGDDGADGHGCCDPDPSDTVDTCLGDMHCRLCTAGVLLMPELPRFDSAGWPTARLGVLRDAGPAPSHAAPPYRPPIS